MKVACGEKCNCHAIQFDKTEVQIGQKEHVVKPHGFGTSKDAKRRRKKRELMSVVNEHEDGEEFFDAVDVEDEDDDDEEFFDVVDIENNEDDENFFDV